MLAIILAVLFTAACIKWGAWKRWREFYPTILYLIIGNLAYKFVFCEYSLWEYRSFMGYTLVGLIIKFIIYPAAVILFLTHYPQPRIKQALYILAWSAGGTLAEVVGLITGGIYYDHGWNLFWSSVLFLGLFIMVRLHYKRPLLVWPISLVCGVVISLIFGLPFPPP